MNVDWDRICDFVFDIFGDDNAEMARYSLIEFGIDPDTRRPIVNEAECEHEWDTDETGEFCVRCYERKK